MPGQVDIDAPVELVWSILVDLSRYAEWNPLTPSVVGVLQEGETLKLTADLGRFQRTQDQFVEVIEENKRLIWSGGIRLDLVRGTRVQTLEPLGDGRCRYRTDDTFRGPLAGFTERFFGEILNRQFQAMADALKVRAEAVAAETVAAEEARPSLAS